MTDERGSTVWSAIYYPFGEMTAGSNNTHGFTGKEFDSEMGLNYFCQRYYDPEIGRFTTLDPQNSPTASPYAYCANCPLVFVDPTGESIERDIVMILGGYIGVKSKHFTLVVDIEGTASIMSTWRDHCGFISRVLSIISPVVVLNADVFMLTTRTVTNFLRYLPIH
ncbi:unnamed protein product [marine sediment metagenome]|uniref:RHS repeat-associated core domain-containing protein n=1 Tax=marine sediment metagenome TaxID=412755 RepID=X1HPT0_9ZZZZ